MKKETIAALATAPGRGGIGVIRVSGPEAKNIAKATLGQIPLPRHAHYGSFYNTTGQLIDEGIALYFPGPNSFTGEDVLELQGHGGPVILDQLLDHTLKLGARMAKPGEFSEQAFLNDKMDLTQAEAIADLIEANSAQAAKQALNSLQGEFSKTINKLVEELIHLRMYVEAAIDFPEEEIDFLSDNKITDGLAKILNRLEQVYHTAKQGAILRDGMKVVIAGRPNAGKSSLLNALSDRDIAIVTDIAGTTRDVLREHIHIDGMPLHIVDTAGIRHNPDKVEKIGIERAWKEIEEADQILLIIDVNEAKSNSPDTQAPTHSLKSEWPEFFNNPKLSEKITVVFNKVDQLENQAIEKNENAIYLSAKTGKGLTQLKSHLKNLMGLESTLEGGFSARRRHLDALDRAHQSLISGQTQLTEYAAGELLAEDLRIAQECLGEITGQFTPDELLGKIFSSFCIGK